MYTTLKTLFIGANARAEERVRDQYSIELIEQKIREAQAGVKGAKLTLASLIQRERAELRQIETLKSRAAQLEKDALAAMADGREKLAEEAATAIAAMENELKVRQDTVDRLKQRIIRLRQSVEAANRRVVDLRQGAIAAKAVRAEQTSQKRIQRHLEADSPMDEAESLIANVLQKDDPFEQSEILREIDRDLGGENIAEKLAEAGYGDGQKSTASDVMKRLRADK